MKKEGERVFRKGQELEISISSLGSGGEGVSRDLGMPIFVDRTAIGDKVKVRIFDARKDFARAEVIEVIEPSVDRQNPPCKIFKVCGGCQWQHIEYSEQLNAKTDIVRQAVKRIGHLDPELVRPAIAAVEPLHYRNKAQFPVAVVPGTGRVLAGYYQRNSHELVNVKHCPVQPGLLDNVLDLAKLELQDRNVSIYDETSHTGLVRHITERYSFASGKVLLTFVVNQRKLVGHDEQKLKSIAATIMREIPEVAGVCINFNPTRGNRIFGDETKCLAGEASIVERLSSQLQSAPARLREGIKFRLSSTSFFQVNTRQAEVLLDQVLLAVTSGCASNDADACSPRVPLLVDAYAGVGTMASWLSSVADRILAIEEMSVSVEDGKVNLQLNDIANVEFIQSRVEDAVQRLLVEGVSADVVVVDPPRKGIDPVGLRALIKLGARRIVYVSCNPATLARDLRLLEESGYKVKGIQPVDMFPQTFHIETVTVVERGPSMK